MNNFEKWLDENLGCYTIPVLKVGFTAGIKWVLDMFKENLSLDHPVHDVQKVIEEEINDLNR